MEGTREGVTAIYYVTSSHALLQRAACVKGKVGVDLDYITHEQDKGLIRALGSAVSCGPCVTLRSLSGPFGLCTSSFYPTQTWPSTCPKP